ncbi:hypothetical protein [Stenotrophomonas maltophilia]|uniref:hypothetical protein n=1 Tax=Stenotrophomonas maltophilia TaxID=40324 RepID=UPI0034DB3A92
MSRDAINTLLAARAIADHAVNQGVLVGSSGARSVCLHMGAVLADSILQAGLNYSNVVRPRVEAILRNYPQANTVSALVPILNSGLVGEFLEWSHEEKIQRFVRLVEFLNSRGVDSVCDLKRKLMLPLFGVEMQRLNGIGPKTVDYMGCLVGIESIAVDRHVRSFARAAGLVNEDYEYLKKIFCFAADFLSLPRREFDAWLWRRAAQVEEIQMSLGI